MGCFLVIVLFAAPSIGAGETVGQAAWDGLLQRHVSAGRVDYEGLAREGGTLTQYLASLEDADPARWSRNEQLAFWINAYNAVVVAQILERYPLKSVRQVGGFFDQFRHRIAGRQLTLNSIETQGRVLGDFRIHFALVCASSSCPPLRSEAYVADHLDGQLSDQARRFLADPENGLRLDSATLWVSKLFNWYTTDFVLAQRLDARRRLTAEKLIDALAPYLPPTVAAQARGRRLGLKFLNYDWSLNAAR